MLRHVDDDDYKEEENFSCVDVEERTAEGFCRPPAHDFWIYSALFKKYQIFYKLKLKNFSLPKFLEKIILLISYCNLPPNIKQNQFNQYFNSNR